MESQTLLLLTGNRRVKKQIKTVEGEAVLNRDDKSGWWRKGEYMGKIIGLKRLGVFTDNSQVLVVSTADGYPVSPYRPDKEVIKKERGLQTMEVGGVKYIFDQMSQKSAKYQVARHNGEARNSLVTNTFAYACLAIVFVTLVIIAIAYLGR